MPGAARCCFVVLPSHFNSPDLNYLVCGKLLMLPKERQRAEQSFLVAA